MRVDSLRVFSSIPVAVVLATFILSGCGAADVSGVRRDQRILARRLADTRADVDSMRVEMARIRGQLQSAGLAPPAPVGGQRGADPTLPGAAGVAGVSGAAGAPYGVSGRSPAAVRPQGGPQGANPAGARWPSGGAAQGVAGTPGNAGWETPQEMAPAVAVAAPLGIDLRGDLARGPDQAEYRSGLEAYQRGDYPNSVQSLRNFVSRNRGSALAPYAHYWIGEAYFSQGKYYEAILAYNEIPTSWPDNDRVPAAKLRQAEAFAASGDLQDARIYLKELIEKYPGTPEAAEAQQRLRSL